MKKILNGFYFISLFLMASCGSDDSVECGVPLGQLATEINGNIGFEPRFVFYRNDPNNENLFDLNAQLVDEN